MASAITWMTPVNVTPGTDTTWVDMNVSSYVPAGASGVILHVYSTTDSGSGNQASFRKNGSTDDLDTFASNTWFCVGVDSSRILEGYVSITDTRVDLVGYFTSDAVFFTNAYDVEPAVQDMSWNDKSIATYTGTDTAIAAIITIRHNGYWGLRKNGSTDSRIYEGADCTFIVGVDGSEVYEYASDDIAPYMYLVGYIKAGVVMNTNATNISLGTTGSWTDLSALPSGATGGFIEVADVAEGTYHAGLRKNGSSENVYMANYSVSHLMGIVEADGSRVIEGKIDSTNMDFFLVGYSYAESEYTNTQRTTTAKGNIKATVSAGSLTAKGDLTGEGITPVTRTKTISAKAAIPQTGEYGLMVTKPTYDVLSDIDPSHYIFNSKYGTLKYHTSGTTQLTLDSSVVSNRVQVAHGLGYIPFVELYAESYESSGTWYYVPFYGYGATTLWHITYTVDATNINIYVESGAFLEEVNFNVKYFIFKNELIFNQEIYVSDNTTATDIVII